MTENLMIDQEVLFQELADRAASEGVNTQEAYEEFVEFVVEEKLQVGEAEASDPLPGLKEHLKSRWPEYQKRLEEGG